MSYTFNEFQRELKKRDIPDNQAYVFTLLYERLSEVLQQQEEMAKLLLTYGDALAKMALMSQHDQKTLSTLAKRAGMVNKQDGVDVASVANEPEQ